MTQPANYSRAYLQVFADNPVARDADAVPEPSTLLLAAAGLAGLAVLRRRQA
ncbi:MAG: PEP-CTERM sorting domain-containing protein [Acidobacteria bacterium]|nr:PEP-CTERM sorting domain-containing protein [Acidobacteriota bacterium]